MELLDYLKGQDAAEQERFAVATGTTLNHLRNVAYRQRIASAALAAQIEIQSHGAVTVAKLRPKDWHLIWDPRINHVVNERAIVGQKGVEPFAA